jgi:hypothetical protein
LNKSLFKLNPLHILSDEDMVKLALAPLGLVRGERKKEIMPKSSFFGQIFI